MQRLIDFLHQIGPFLIIPILLAGLYKWHDFNKPFRIYFSGIILVALVAVLRSQLNYGNGWFYISAFLGVTLYGFFFQTILRDVINVRIIWFCVAGIWGLIGWYVLQHNTNNFQLWVIIPYDLFMIFFCGLYVVHCLQKPDYLDSSVFFLALYLLMEFCFNLFLDMMSNFLYAYFSDNFMSLLWKKILPVYNLFRLTAILWIILSVKPKLPALDKMPSFDK